MMDNQPEALRLADALGMHTHTLMLAGAYDGAAEQIDNAAAELRRLHAENERLRIEAQNSNEAWDALTDHAGRVSVENERLRAAADLVRAQALDEAYAACRARVVGDHNREDREAKRCADAILALKEKQ